MKKFAVRRFRHDGVAIRKPKAMPQGLASADDFRRVWVWCLHVGAAVAVAALSIVRYSVL